MFPTARLLNAAGRQALQKGAKRDPELYVLLGIMTCAIGGAGFYLTNSPPSSGPKNADDTFGKRNWGRWEHSNPKEAPSALHSVVVPNVNLPKELHEKYNKYGKEGY